MNKQKYYSIPEAEKTCGAGYQVETASDGFQHRLQNVPDYIRPGDT